MDDAVALVTQRKRGGALYGDDGRVREQVLRDLGPVGYWGLCVPVEFGGSGADWSSFLPFLTRMATVEGAVAGALAIHSSIAGANAIGTFGDAEQRARLLPSLASGERVGVFGLTEPGAGSDLTAMCTTATLDGDHYVVRGEKLFLSNLRPGRLLNLVCLVDGAPAVLVVELPDSEGNGWRLREYGLHALSHLHNRAIVFDGLRVPRQNLLRPAKGDGLSIAYHGLNRGRVALCANAAGTMRQLLAGMLPWSRRRVTHGRPIAQRELVERRLGELAASIVGCDALVAWCAGLLDRGYRAEIECIVAKTFAADALKHAAIDLAMKTHGGRSFLVGHPIGDHLHDYLAPSIYEGEGDVLGLALFRSLVKDHAQRYYAPIAQALQNARIERPQRWNPRHVMVLVRAAAPVTLWRGARRLGGTRAQRLPSMPPALEAHARLAARELPRMGVEIDAALRKHGTQLAGRQCRVAELSQRTQELATLLVVALRAAEERDPLRRDAGIVLGDRLARRLTGARPTDGELRRVVELGRAVAAGAGDSPESLDLASVVVRPILKDYPQA
jgi:alkylation response protein AidB-like acyl-CoA dehydrogenase